MLSVSALVAPTVADDRLRAARRHAQQASLRRTITPAPAAITIRHARPADADALRVLAALDSHAALDGSALVAENHRGVIAAIALADDTVIADPFTHTAAAVELLRTRAQQLRGAGLRAPRARLRLRVSWGA